MRKIQPPLFAPDTDWVPPTSLPDLTGHKEIAIDLETRDPNLLKMGSGSVRGDGEIVGIAVAVEGWKGYFPIAHEDNRGCLDKKVVMRWFQKLLKTDSDKIFHNAMYDVSWIRSVGLTINGRIYDTMIAASLVDENRWGFTLDGLAKQYTGIGKNEKLLQEAAKAWGVNPKSEMWRMPAMYVGEYAEQDAESTLKLWQAMKHELTQQDLWQIFDMETCLLYTSPSPRDRG